MNLPQMKRSSSTWAAADTPENRWSLDGLSATEIQSDQSRDIPFEDGADHLVMYRTRQLCSMRCEIGERVITGESRPGQLFVVPPRTRGSFQLAGPHTTWMFHLSGKLLEDALAGGPGSEKTEIRLRATTFRQDPVIQNVLSPLIQEIKGDGQGRSPLVAALARVLAVQLLRRYSEAAADPCAPQLSPHRLKSVLRYMDENCCEPVPLASLADLTQLSPHYFLRLFKQSTGTTPHHYLLRKRIDKAKRLLTESKLGMVEVALETGFPSQSHFGTIFKKMTGMTPKAWLHSEEAANSN